MNARANWEFGIEPESLAILRESFARHGGLANAWLFGSRARGDARANSDIDIAIDAPDWSAAEFSEFRERLRQLPIVYSIDAVHWQGAVDEALRAQISRDRASLWAPGPDATTPPLLAA
jgi:type III restriction enzyme